MKECCGNCKQFSVDHWLFPKINGDCVAPKMKYDKKSKKVVEVSSGPGLHYLYRRDTNVHGRSVIIVFDWSNIDPKRDSCERFIPGKETVLNNTDQSVGQAEIWKKYS